MFQLESIGWGHDLAEQAKLRPNLEPGRVVRHQGPTLAVTTQHGTKQASLTGRLEHDAPSRSALPTVGDWVGCTDVGPLLMVDQVYDRRTTLQRKAAGRGVDRQVIAANVDVVYLVTAMNDEFNLRRIERYAVAVRSGGAQLRILVSKADLATDPGGFVEAANSIAPAIAVSGLTGAGLQDIHLEPCKTYVFVGSSGVGKSTLLNQLMGQPVQAVLPIRHDDTGRHTTTSAAMFPLPGGAWLIDTPGMRELGLWTDADLSSTFGDVEDLLAERCQFRNCAHDTEPGCVINQAIELGNLSQERWQAYCKLQREIAHLQRRSAQSSTFEERRARRKQSKMIRRVTEDRRKMRGE